jgi:hypothetical protein
MQRISSDLDLPGPGGTIHTTVCPEDVYSDYSKYMRRYSRYSKLLSNVSLEQLRLSSSLSDLESIRNFLQNEQQLVPTVGLGRRMRMRRTGLDLGIKRGDQTRDIAQAVHNPSENLTIGVTPSSGKSLTIVHRLSPIAPRPSTLFLPTCRCERCRVMPYK